MDTPPPLKLQREGAGSYKQHSKPKLPPFTRGENPTCPSPGALSPAATITKTAAGAAQIQADSVSISPPFSKSSAGETASGTARAGLPHLAPLLPSTVATAGVVQHGSTAVGTQRRQQQHQRTKSVESPSTARQLQSPTAAQQQQLHQRRTNSQATGIGAANSMSIETGVLSPRRVSLPSTTSSSPSPPPTSPQRRYRPGQLSPRSVSTTSTTGTRASPSSDGADLVHSSSSPTASSATTAFQYKSLSSAPSAGGSGAGAGGGAGSGGGGGGGVPPVSPSLSPSRAAGSQGSHGHGPKAAHHHSVSAIPHSAPGDLPAAGRSNAELRPRAQSDVGIKNATAVDAEQDLQEQLAKLGASLNKLKSFSRSNSLSKGRCEPGKDYSAGSQVAATRLANSDAAAAAPRAAPASRPRRLTRTASDSDSLRYDFDLRPCTGRSPLAVKEADADVEEDSFDTFPEDGKRLSTDSAPTRKRRELRNAAGKPPTARPKSLAAGKGKGVQRSVTFSQGNESAMRRHVYGNNGDDHHAIAALPPDLLLKRILFDKTGGSSPPSSPAAVK